MATSDITPLLAKTIKKNLYLEDREVETVYDQIFKTDHMSQRFVDYQQWEGYGLPEQRLPGQTVKQGQFRPSFAKRYIAMSYALGDSIPDEDVQDDLYGIIHRMCAQKGGMLARMFHTLFEITCANWIATNGYASGTNLGGMIDGMSLFNTAHPVSAYNIGTTFANRPSVDADLSMTSFNSAWTSMVQQPEPNGIQLINNKPRLLVVNPNQHMVATQLVKGQWEAGTGNRNMNVYREAVRVVEWPYFRLSNGNGTWNAWFMLGEMHQLELLIRNELTMHSDFDSGTNSHVFNYFNRWTLGASDWRATYGSI